MSRETRFGFLAAALLLLMGVAGALNAQQFRVELKDTLPATASSFVNRVTFPRIVSMRGPYFVVKNVPEDSLRSFPEVRKEFVKRPGLPDSLVIYVTKDGFSVGNELSTANAATISTALTVDFYQSIKNAKSLGDSGQGIVAVIMDSGIDSTHPEVAGKVLNLGNFGYNGPPDDVSSQSGSNSSAHGHFVAGQVCGKTVGIAPGAVCGIMRITTIVNGQVGAYDSSQWDALTRLAGSPYLMGNMSYGSPSPSSFDGYGMYDPIKQVKDVGKVILFSAGNGGGQLWWPAVFANGISVGSVNDANQRSSFSSNDHNTAWDGTEYAFMHSAGVTMSCPGENIYGIAPNNGFTNKSGTSMSAPNCAGTIAVLQSHRIRKGLPPLSPDSVVIVLCASAIKGVGIGCGVPRIDLAIALLEGGVAFSGDSVRSYQAVTVDSFAVACVAACVARSAVPWLILTDSIGPMIRFTVDPSKYSGGANSASLTLAGVP